MHSRMPRAMAWTALLSLTALLSPTDAWSAPKRDRKTRLPDPTEVAASINAELKELWTEVSRADWVASTYITVDTEELGAIANERRLAKERELLDVTKRYRMEDLPAEVARQFHLLRVSSAAPAPSDPAMRSELAQIMAKLRSMYGSGKWCPTPGSDEGCQDLGALSKVMATSRDYDELEAAWTRWRTVSPPMAELYERFVALANEGAREIGFADLGVMWRSGYDMPPEQFEAEAERLWQTVRPLYQDLHCFVRAKLAETYPGKVSAEGPIPAHLLGNMWSQEWMNIYPLVEPFPGKSSLDVTGALKAQKWDAVRMVKQGERFFTDLGLKPLPATFYERSQLTKPRDREVVCHASAWDVTYNNDVRIKMCIEPTEEELITIHHELGHIYYYQYYYDKPVLYQAGAHDGFHEAIGDALALSVTPQYLKEIGILDQAPDDPEGLLNVQLKVALDKIAFLPFGRLIDQWRWDVFSGKVPASEYNSHWWQLRRKYQGIAPPADRPDFAFDPGAKFHIPDNTPYVRYFLSFIIQFQFHKALCEAAGHTGPLHTCSIAGSQEAGRRLSAMLALGASRPWPEAMEALTGQRSMDASALMEYFAPLRAYLQEQNAGRTCGW